MVEYTEREGMQIELEDTSREISIGDTYVDRYNYVVDIYNETCERPCEKLEHLTKNCCAQALYCGRCVTLCSGITFLVMIFLCLGVSFPMHLMIWLTNLPSMLTYRRNNKKVPNLLGRFIYCPELCGDHPNRYYNLSLRYYKAGILSFNGQDMHIDAARIKVVGDKISFMVYNEILSNYATGVGLLYKFYTAQFVISTIIGAPFMSFCFFYKA